MKIWDYAKTIIPGGNQLVSKRPDRYCPGIYPSHYTWAHGNQVIDTNGEPYTDFSTMGIGTCILGYGDPDVDAEVISCIAAGNMSSLNPVEEVELAEALLLLNPKMDMVRFARTGGEACKIAVEICRAFTGRFAYYHHGYSGWLLGHPEKTYGNDIHGYESLEALDYLKAGQKPACIIMEPVRNYPDESYSLMKEVRKWCDDNFVPLIFDEVTSGFRCNIGGYHATKGVYPDIVVYGKALGNGYAISAVVGAREIMEAAEKTFISSTMWSERTGYAAALATLEQMRKKNVPDKLIRIGKIVQDHIRDLSDIYDLEIEVTGIPPLAHFEFKEDHDKKITFFTQEMLKHNYLATDQFYASAIHASHEIEVYKYHMDEIFSKISEGKIELEGEIRTAGWKRVN
jgi:glutamate-1-semialdehyde 2,1-aminomutase